MNPLMSGVRALAGLRAGAAAAAAATVAMTMLTAFAAAPTARADAPAIPDFTDSHGLTRVVDATEVRSETDFTLTVTTPQVSGPHKIRVFLPEGYAADPGKRWPVTYFLHGGGGTVDDAAAVPALRSDKMITVVPDGGLKGWYADWVMQNTAVGAANWQTFHLEQVVPFIDANLRTLPGKDHRAVVGLSMGGYGALRYAEARPDLFGHTAALSGGIDFGMPADPRRRRRHGTEPHRRVVRGEHLDPVGHRRLHGLRALRRQRRRLRLPVPGLRRGPRLERGQPGRLGQPRPTAGREGHALHR